MTPEMKALGRRAVACRGWRWMPGMLTLDGFRCVWADAEQIECAASRAHNFRRPNSATDLPDLTDPATLGCLLALIRELLEDPTGCVSWYEGDAENAAGWSYVSETYGASDTMPTESEALVVTLEDIVMEEDDD